MNLKKVLGVLTGMGILVGGAIAWNTYQKTEIVHEVERELTDLTTDQIKKIELYDGDLMILKRENDNWINITYPNLEMDEQKINQLLKEICEATSYKDIKNVQEQQQYGINEYSRVVTLYDENDEVHTFRIGASDGTSNYIWSDSSKRLYFIEQETIDTVLKGKNYLIDNELEIEEDIYKLEIILDGQHILLTQKKDSWFLEGPFRNARELDEEGINFYLEILEEMEKKAFVGEDELNNKYGLEEPYLIIEINEDQLLTFGKHDKEDIYFVNSREPFVYLMDATLIKPFEDINHFELINPQIFNVELEEVEYISIQKGGQQIEWLFETVTDLEQQDAEVTEEAKEQSSDDQVEVTEETIIEDDEEIESEIEIKSETEIVTYINGVIVENEIAEELLLGVTDISIYNPLVNPDTENKSDRKAEVIIIYELRDGTEKILEFVPYDPSFYLLREDRYIEFSVQKSEVVKAIDPFFN